MKLTETQKEIIKLMRKGYRLNKDYGKFGGKYWLIDACGSMKLTDGRSVSGLQYKGVILREPYQVFSLTKLGKTISL